MKTTNNAPTITTKQSFIGGYGDNTILRIKGTYYRHMVGCCKRGESARKEYQGALIEGPWAYTFGLCAMITSHDRSDEIANEEKRTIEVETGNQVIVDEVLYEVVVNRREYINLVKIADLRK